MGTRMMLRTTSKNNVPLQLLRLMKDKTVYKSFPTVSDQPSVFCGGSWTMSRNGSEMKDAFIREMGKTGLMSGGGLEFFKRISNGAVEMRGRKVVSDEDEDKDGFESGDMDDFDDDGGVHDDDDDDDFGDGDEDSDEDEIEKYVRKGSK